MRLPLSPNGNPELVWKAITEFDSRLLSANDHIGLTHYKYLLCLLAYVELDGREIGDRTIDEYFTVNEMNQYF